MINENQALHWNETDKKPYFSNSTRPMSYLSSWDRHVKSWCTNNWNKPKKIIELYFSYEDDFQSRSLEIFSEHRKEIINEFK